jgi:hypothetical protein
MEPVNILFCKSRVVRVGNSKIPAGMVPARLLSYRCTDTNDVIVIIVDGMEPDIWFTLSSKSFTNLKAPISDGRVPFNALEERLMSTTLAKFDAIGSV